MSRLIDADVFEKFIEEKYKDGESTDDIKDQVLFDLSYQPTAYDVDKVVEQLEKEAEKAKRNSEKAEELGPDYERHKIVFGTKGNTFEKAIEIVKAGGKCD